MKNIIILMLIGLPFLNMAQIQVFPGPPIHTVDSVFIDYSENPPTIFIREKHMYNAFRRLSIEQISQDTLCVNLFFLNCHSFWEMETINDTIIEAPIQLDTPFNLIVKTLYDTNRVHQTHCYIRGFYTLMDSVFISADEHHYVKETLSTPELKNIKQIKIYPNPTSDFVYIDNPSNSKIEGVLIYNLQGKKVFELTKPNDKIDISKLEPGPYTIVLNLNNNQVHHKLIIQ